MPNASAGSSISASSQIVDGVIDTPDIKDNSITKAKIPADQIEASELADNSVAEANIIDGAIVNADINASAAIVDTKLATISTAGKVNGAALTGLASIPAGAGVIPAANLPASSLTYKNSVTTRGGNSASSTQNIAHGLGVTPKRVKITVQYAQAGIFVESIGAYNGTTNSCVYWFTNGLGTSNSVTASNDSSNGVHMEVVSGGTQFAVITFDGTNIILTWTASTGVGANNMNILWEAEG